MHHEPLSANPVVRRQALPYKMGALVVFVLLLVAVVGLSFRSGPRSVEAAASAAASTVDTVSAPDPTIVSASTSPLPLPELSEAAAQNASEPESPSSIRVAEARPAEQQEEKLGPAGAWPDLVLGVTSTEAVNGGEPFAVINGRKVQVGDTIGALVVESITQGVVILVDGVREPSTLPVY